MTPAVRTSTDQRRSGSPTRCNGHGGVIPAGELHLQHTRWVQGGECTRLYECQACAARNGRGPLAEPETAEQPLDLEGIA